MEDDRAHGLLVLNVWTHDGRLVARLSAADRLDGHAYEVGVEVGAAAIAGAVERWLRAREPGATTGCGRGNAS